MEKIVAADVCIELFSGVWGLYYIVYNFRYFICYVDEEFDNEDNYNPEELAKMFDRCSL
ncbi:hypothetical protein C1645_826232 [Glomus cerebriforme]|uniref:Uncharacterized protein n=1 Tax=Glomus cerebriforme TaxID=658196 RepID=A0A397SV63_9GLOM|nr:hypothetical protein C1645_826232 [Glomus cerebriforme]